MRRAKYFTPTPYGSRGSIRIHGTLYQKHFPTGTPDVDRMQWVIDTEMEHRTGTVIRGSFKEDAGKYLKAVAAMASYSDRKRHIELWAVGFGDQSRRTITSAQIAAQLQTWRAT